MARRPTGQGRVVLTVRARMLAAFLALSAFALVLAGGAAYLLQREQVDARIDESLRQAAGEVSTLSASGTNPVTGEPFSSTEDVVVAAMQLMVPARNEGVVGLRDARAPLVTQQSVQVHLEDDPALLEALAADVAGTRTVLRSVTTPVADYRAVVVPVLADPTSADASATGQTPPPSPGAPVTPDTGTALVLAYDRGAEQAEFTRVFGTYALVALVALLLTGVVGWVVAGRLLRPIRVLARTAQDIGESDLSARIPVTGNDDLSHLSRTVNGMLDRLEGAFESQRRLLDDVGHELRTPLTVVRGHLELMDPQDPQDARETRDLTLDELDRMNRLVDDLVTLATIGRPDFVRPADADVGRLTDDVHDKIRTLGDRRWLVDARADVVAPVDSQRLTQALLQLAANAVKFSADGTVVAIGSAVSDDGTRLRLWVRDEGVGIAPDQADRIFERFAQAPAPAGRERPEGAGLGLAIVSAIAEGHGGHASVASTPGVGSTFTLDLPVESAAVPTGTTWTGPGSTGRAAPGPTAPTVPTVPTAPTPTLPAPGDDDAGAAVPRTDGRTHP
ncbi:sensor histidine kinase [Cellulosimicrobium marinum]|uniref:sensor histidine kinase n=1 Tax=Cellulosimicrobium marinum TaxID=1638992 RepID=UPI001E4AFAD2|nr:HAMP domain-containing sensor histidine kinase [Cellulosimicrobium marinum]MCB7136804.1 HAMP domain-containing histidine kinase [Cellulosimicrobium marinum]